MTKKTNDAAIAREAEHAKTDQFCPKPKTPTAKALTSSEASSAILKTIRGWQNGQIGYDVLEMTIKNIVTCALTGQRRVEEL